MDIIERFTRRRTYTCFPCTLWSRLTWPTLKTCAAWKRASLMQLVVAYSYGSRPSQATWVSRRKTIIAICRFIPCCQTFIAWRRERRTILKHLTRNLLQIDLINMAAGNAIYHQWSAQSNPRSVDCLHRWFYPVLSLAVAISACNENIIFNTFTLS